MFSPCPFWFARPELLTNVRSAEIDAVAQILGKHPNLRSLFDTPDATLSQRSACFMLLAHVELVKVVDDTFITRYEQSPSLSKEEADTLRSTHSLVASDAPVWVSEMNQVVQQLSAHVNASLPEPLRAGGYKHDNPEQMRAIESAKKTLGSVEQIQALTERVLDQQLQRLVRRWSANIVQVRRPNKRKGWEQREKLYEAIRRALKANPSLQGVELCAELDKRHAPPLYDWQVSGEWPEGLTWKEAWSNPILRDRIRRVRQEAQKTC
jgi:hypothetical protein